MLTVKTHIDKSKVAGFGLFASENIKKETVVWKLNPLLDVLLPVEEFWKQDKITKKFLNFYMYDLKTEKGYYVVCLGDNARFVNHSNKPNIKNVNHIECIATRNIKKGEEITEDYRTFWYNRKKFPKSWK